MINSSEKLKIIVFSNIKHDLTNPINAILGYSELLLDIIDRDLVMLKNDIKSIHDSGNSILNDIKKMVTEKKILYDHFADQRKINRWDSQVVLQPLHISHLPEYISLNKEKFKDWLEG